MAFGYTAAQGGRLVLMGWFYNVTQPDAANAQVFGKIYNGSLDEAGARQVAREFAADILKQFGMESLAGIESRFRFDSNGRERNLGDGLRRRQSAADHEIRVDFDDARCFAGWNKSGIYDLCAQSARDPDSLARNVRRLPFFNQNASMNATPSFTPDGKQIVFSSTLAGGYAQIYIADANGSNLQRLDAFRGSSKWSRR